MRKRFGFVLSLFLLIPACSSTEPVAEETATPEPSTLTIPDLRGDTRAKASRTLRDLGLIVEITFSVTPRHHPGTVMGIRPDRGTEVEPGDKVTLEIARDTESNDEDDVVEEEMAEEEDSESPSDVHQFLAMQMAWDSLSPERRFSFCTAWNDANDAERAALVATFQEGTQEIYDADEVHAFFIVRC